MESRHVIWTAVGAALLAVGATSLLTFFMWAQNSPQLHLWETPWFDAAFGALGLLTLIGLYALASPMLGLYMPPPRSQPFWRREHSPAPSIDSVPVTSHAVNGSSNTSVSEVNSTASGMQPGERMYADVAPEDLMSFFENLTDIQGKKLAAPYIGTWMTVSGVLGDVGSSSPHSAQVTFAHRSGQHGTVYMYFQGESRIKRLSVLRVGQQITVRGQIESVNSATVTLVNCELVA